MGNNQNKHINQIQQVENGFIVHSSVPVKIECGHQHWNGHNNLPQYNFEQKQHVFNDFQAVSDFLKEFYGK